MPASIAPNMVLELTPEQYCLLKGYPSVEQFWSDVTWWVQICVYGYMMYRELKRG
jgi:hypothetical protein